MPKRCFISYRRQDSRLVAENIGSRINQSYRKRVFLDDSEAWENGIEPGNNFVERIQREIGESAVMLAVVGREWEQLATTKQEHGETDWAIFEIKEALNREPPVPIIPVLIDGAVPPISECVPEGFRHAEGIALRSRPHEAYEADMRTLMARVKDLMGPPDNLQVWNQAMLLTWAGSLIFLLLFKFLRPPDQQQASYWLAYLPLLPGAVTLLLAYTVPLDPQSVFIRSVILYLGLFILFGLSLTWLVGWELTAAAPLGGVVLALVTGLLAAAIARK